MAEPVLSVCWKNHTSELATEYKSLLENNFLVDCTLSAEGQRLKAHRLILSACSPYFQMLFQEDSGKHPFVILLNASFETLKAVIDFVYQGETHIPERNLKAFLTLAQSLQIKGLNAFTQDDKNKNQSSSTAENVPLGSSENNQVTSEVAGINASLGSRGNYSQQHPYLSDSYSDTVQTNSSIPGEAYSTSRENVQSATSVTHLAQHHRSLGCDEVFADSEVTVKHEPLYNVFPETRNKTPVNVKSYECGAGNFQREMDVGTTTVCGEEDSQIFSICSESSRGNMESTLMPPAQEQRTQLSDEVPSGRDGEETFQPASLVLKKEHLEDESDDMMDDRDIPVNYANEAYEGMESAYDEQNLDQCSSTAGLPPEELTSQWSPPGQQSESSPPHTELQSHEGEETVLGDEGGTASPHPPNASTHKPRRKGKGRCPCGECNNIFTRKDNLRTHMRIHTHSPNASTHKPRRKGKGRFPCGECNNTFTRKDNLRTHMRIHTHSPSTSTHKPRRAGKPPFRCEVCENAFQYPSKLAIHMRSHTGERPFRCDTCGEAFTQKSSLTNHQRIHTGERPFGCDVCGRAFTERGNLVTHMRTHTGEQPFRCDVCGKTFARSNALVKHCRTHTGARPYHCDVCSKTFRQQGNLRRHVRSHTGVE